MDNSIIWILIGGLLMSAIAMVGSVTTVLRAHILERILLPLVSLAAGTLLGSAFFHMIPKGMDRLAPLSAATWLVGGFTIFLGLEQFLHWHHTHQDVAEEPEPKTYLILVGDALHNFIGGVSVASTFLLDMRAGMVAWLAAAAHEVPQELGDFGVLVHGGWSKRRALYWNLFSALSFPVGAIFAYFVSRRVDVTGLMLFGAGNFIYIAASDLIPEIKAETKLRTALLNFSIFVFGLLLVLALARWSSH
jgi:zinc and cadmium transporter